MRSTTILVDDAIVDIEPALQWAGQVVACPGADIDRAALAGADILVTRSVTRVDADLLRDTTVSLVVTATAGIDHVDTEALSSSGVAFASAAGCNAQAVAEYVLGALAVTAAQRPRPPSGPVGIVGFGHTGRRAATVLRAAGHTVLACDPPLLGRRANPAVIDFDPRMDRLARDEPLVSLEALLDQCAVLSLHVPKTSDGPHQTEGLIDADALRRLSPGVTIVAASRGGIIDEVALQRWLEARGGAIIMDVFADEPRLKHPRLLTAAAVALVTPHVAGYTAEGKRNATSRAVAAVAAHLQRRAPPTAVPPLPPAMTIVADGHQDVGSIIAQVHAPLRRDDQRLRALASLDVAARARAFEGLRTQYAFRREHSATTIVGVSDPDTRSALEAVGLQLAPAS